MRTAMTVNSQSMNDLAAQSLELVSRELGTTLDAARAQLEAYVDGQAGREALIRCAELLHLACGALKIVDVQGGALLTEEMELACRHLFELRDGDRTDEGMESLTRAMVQLPAYLDRLLTGGSDIALVLLPLLNELRAVRGKPLMSEGTLLLLDVGQRSAQRSYAYRGRKSEEAASLADMPGGFRSTVHKLRPAFQTALLGWIRGHDTDNALTELVRVSDAVLKTSTMPAVQQFWDVLSAVLIAVSEGALEATVAVKRLVGQADRQLKRLAEGGEAVFANAPPDELLNNLLYYVARSGSQHARVEAVRTAFDLHSVVPQADELELAREGLAGPSARLMQTVAQAIKEDMGTVKDVLDIFVRTGRTSAEQLAPQADMLRKISETLGVLGLTGAREEIHQQASTLDAIAAGRSEPDQSVLEQVAGTLLAVEEALDRELVKAVMPAGAASREAGGETQYRHVAQAVMGECIVNLARIKEAVVDLVDDPSNVRALDKVKPQLRGITAGLLMLDKVKAVRVVERIGDLIASRLVADAVPLRPEHLERLADAIVSVEYFMETVSAGRNDPLYMLDNAERCLSLLENLPAAKSQKPPAAPVPAEIPPPVAAKPKSDAPVMDPGEGRSDPELLELFIEEAREEMAGIRRRLPLWSDNPDDSDALIAIRRSFHTLKGSGRMVGAQLIGQFAWSIESLLNRLINQTLSVTPELTAFVTEAANALPELIEQLEIGLAPRVNVHLLMKRAEAFVNGESDAITADEPVPPATEAPSVPAAADSWSDLPMAGIPDSGSDAGTQSGTRRMDPVLAEIFIKETHGHLQAVSEFVATAECGFPPHEVDEDLYRAWHTLLGSARMANFEPVLAVAGPVSEYLGRCYEAGAGISSGELGLLSEAAAEIGLMADALDASTPYEANVDLVGRLASLSNRRVEPQAGRDPAPEVGDDSVDPEPEPGFDPDIAAIFVEEAAELLESAESAVVDLRTDPEDAVRRGELQRVLHTLKGGARMAGIVAMGDLSHALESLLEVVARRDRDQQAAAYALVQESMDTLHQMRDRVAAGRGVPAVDAALLDRIARHGSDDDSDEAQSGEPAPAAFEPPAPQEPAQVPASTGADSLAAAAETPVASVDWSEAQTEAQADPRFAGEVEGQAGDDAPAPTDEPSDEADAGEAEEMARMPAPSDEALQPALAAGVAASPSPAPAAPARPESRISDRTEYARVDSALLDTLLNGAGEISIFQSRLNQQIHSVEFHLGELGQTVTRLREQLRKLESETEAQILHGHQGDLTADEGFDPLELDRYSTIQQLSRGLAESANDVASINELLRGLTAEADTLLTQQGRATAQLQDGLMQTRMVPFQRHVSRLARIVRQAAADSGRQAELSVEGATSEIDRQVLDSMLPAFEHLLRNAVVHGIERPDDRAAAGKPPIGKVTLRIHREGSEVAIEVADDGRGLDVTAIQRKALEQGLLSPGQKLSDAEARELILRPGFSTAGELTQTAGRGVGMDVVDNEIKKLGGVLRIESTAGQGTRFLIRLPYTLAITQALIVKVGDETFALPLPTVEGIARVPREHLLELLTEDEPGMDYGGVSYRLQHLGTFVGGAPAALPDEEGAVALVLVRAGEYSAALLTDSLEGSREIVVKTLGPHLSGIAGVSGATILGDGRVIVILDIGTLVRTQQGGATAAPAPMPEPVSRPLTALVVDDSITMRRVTQRLLERRGVRVVTARDGLDAIATLQDAEPDIILLDIEMPRMDGYQFAKHVRNDPRIADVPIIMITSRSGEKHRARAIEIGVNDYLSKPYQENQLIGAVEALLGRTL